MSAVRNIETYTQEEKRKRDKHAEENRQINKGTNRNI